jgi:hypothetical protein
MYKILVFKEYSINVDTHTHISTHLYEHTHTYYPYKHL